MSIPSVRSSISNEGRSDDVTNFETNLGYLSHYNLAQHIVRIHCAISALEFVVIFSVSFRIRSMSWGELPILPLCRIYECLSIKDCLAASSCCTNWRYAFKFHRIKRNQLCLKVDSDNFEKNVFLADAFGRHVKELKIVLASSIDVYSRFFSQILRRFYESKHLTSITYVPTFEYLTFERTHNKDFIQSVLVSSLLEFCESSNLQGININGCSELTVHIPSLLQAIRYPKYYRFLGLAKLRSTSSIVAPLNPNLFTNFISLKYLSLDYECISEELLVGIRNRMPCLKKLVLNIVSVPINGFQDMTSAWLRLRIAEYTIFTVTINCICLEPEYVNDFNENVLCEGLPLEVLRIMFCRSMNLDILRKLVNYSETFKELVWVDSIMADCMKNGLLEGRRRSARRSRQQTPNPLVMMCWQCSLLEKITLHGYWHSAHDLLGMARLRGSSLQSLDVSALLPPTPSYYTRQPFTPTCLTQEEMTTNGPNITTGFIQKMKSALKFPWHVPKWGDLHPSLRGDSDDDTNQVQEYIINVIKHDIPSICEM